MTDLADLIDRYVDVWNEPDEDARRRSIERLWRPDGAHLTPTREAVGYDAIVARISLITRIAFRWRGRTL